MIAKLANFIRNYGFCLHLVFKANKFNFFCIMVINITTGIIPFLNLYVMKGIIDDIVNILSLGASGSASLWGAVVSQLILYFGITIAVGFISDFGGKITGLQTQNLLTYINISLMRKSADIDISYFDIPDKFDDMSRSRNNSHAMHEIVFSTVSTFTAIINLITAFILSIRINVWLTLLTFLSLIPSFLFRKGLEKRRYEFDKSIFREDRQNGYINSLLFNKQAAKELRFFGMVDPLLARYLKKDRELFLKRKSFNKKNNFIGVLLGLPQMALSIGIQIYIVIRIMGRMYTLGDLSYIPGVYSNLSNGIGSLIGSISMYIGYNQKIADFKQYFMFSESDVTSGELQISAVNSIEFRDVCFTYPGTARQVLSHVSFRVDKGEKIALIGINGSGKTTIIKLLMRFYEPDSGSIYINGIDACQLDIKGLRAHLSIVFQNYNIYSFTVRENVGVSSPARMQDDTPVREALAFSEFHNDVFDRNGNLDTFVGKIFDPDGIELSGGQNQKLAISRAVFREADTIVLDEPTASLDPEAEHQILSYFKKMYVDKTLVMVSHRMSNMTLMDRILVMENGSMIESGSHQELMALGGQYAYLFHLQEQKYTAGVHITK